MKVDPKINFENLVGLLQVATVKRSNLDSLPCRFVFWHRLRRYSFPVKLENMQFEQFIRVVKYADNEAAAVLFLSAISELSTERISKLPARRLYPLWLNYLKQVETLLTAFKQVNDDMPAGRGAVKTMEEFGLLNIVFFISGEDTGSYSKILEQSVSWVYVHYRHRAHAFINQVTQTKNKGNVTDTK
jgi:hypothetical protein